jgi:transposase
VRVGESYAEHWKVERIFTWLVSFQRLLVGHERYLFTFWAFLLVAFARMSLRRF